MVPLNIIVLVTLWLIRGPMSSTVKLATEIVMSTMEMVMIVERGKVNSGTAVAWMVASDWVGCNTLAKGKNGKSSKNGTDNSCKYSSNDDYEKGVTIVKTGMVTGAKIT